MASYTTNLNLKKPAGSENVAIGDINNNMDTIDTAYGTLNSNITGHIIQSTNYVTTEAITVPAYSGKEIVAMNTAIGQANKNFISATIFTGTVAGLAVLFVHQTLWGDTKYLTAKNPSGNSLTIPAGTTIGIFYI